MSALEFWEDRYAGKPRVWSGRANQLLVDLASGLTPGRALDLGCGEGGDSIWLAQQGWLVTGIDISETAIERARGNAASAGIPEGRIEWLAHDLETFAGEGAFDLVSAFFLQSPVELASAEILRRAARLIAPGGHLFIVSHAAPPPWATQLDGHHHDFLTPAEQIASLQPQTENWDVVIAENRERSTTGPQGEPATLIDAIVLLRRP